MRLALALVFLQRMVNEIIAALLGPLPLPRRPKSKPITPWDAYTRYATAQVTATLTPVVPGPVRTGARRARQALR